jgi:hypothetical protein
MMNIFSCPFESKEESKYPYKREDLFALQRISFAIEQAITTFFETTRNNEKIFEVDFLNNRVQEIHTKYNGEPEIWGWQENVKEQLSKVKPISNIVIRDAQDIYGILTNREKLECLLQEYENKNHYLEFEQKKVCCDENTPYVPDDDNNNTNMKMIIDAINCNNANVSHKGENRHSKNTRGKQDNENLKADFEDKIKEEFEKSVREQLILLKESRQDIIDFLSGNKDSIKIEDLKIYEPVYKCYREKGNCIICNTISNIICINCCNHYNNEEIWVCTSHWQKHRIENH